jgi:hypothetical protein
LRGLPIDFSAQRRTTKVKNVDEGSSSGGSGGMKEVRSGCPFN